MDLALNNQQRLICYETQPTNQPTIHRGIIVIVIGNGHSDPSSNPRRGC